MKFNTKKIFLIAGGVIILLAVLLLILTRTTSEEQKPAEQTATSTQQEEKNAVPASKEDINKSNVLVLASSFSERFGSFSNQSDFQNIRDLFPFMTASMKNWAENYIEVQKAGGSYDVYSGVTTKSISRKILSINDDSAEILVSTQRREFTGTMANENVIYQDIELKLVKEGEEWKIDGVWWK